MTSREQRSGGSNPQLLPDRNRIARIAAEVTVVAVLTVISGLTTNSITAVWVVGFAIAGCVVAIEWTVMRRRIPASATTGRRADEPTAGPTRRRKLTAATRALLAIAVVGLLITAAVTQSGMWFLVALGVGALEIVFFVPSRARPGGTRR